MKLNGYKYSRAQDFIPEKIPPFRDWCWNEIIIQYTDKSASLCLPFTTVARNTPWTKLTCVLSSLLLLHSHWFFTLNIWDCISGNDRSNGNIILVAMECTWPVPMMTSSNGNIFRVTGHLCGEFTGHRWIPRTKANDAELWWFLWSAPE